MKVDNQVRSESILTGAFAAALACPVNASDDVEDAMRLAQECRRFKCHGVDKKIAASPRKEWRKDMAAGRRRNASRISQAGFCRFIPGACGNSKNSKTGIHFSGRYK
jgi:hypothetical protein